MAMTTISNTRIVLGSQSPRRAELLRNIGLSFDIMPADVDETLPEGIDPQEAVRFLAEKKAKAVQEINSITEGVIIASDTVVVSKGEIIGKPVDETQVKDFLSRISGTNHEVYTGVAIWKIGTDMHTFDSLASVSMTTISNEEMDFYIKNGNPFDKAGAYGIQEWIGWAKIEKIEGTFATIMGLPVSEVYEYLKKIGVINLSK